MATRRDAREWIVQVLFQVDINPASEEHVFPAFWSDKEADPASREFTERAVSEIMRNRADIDERIRKCAEHWDLSRMAVIDRNVIRLAVYEMFYRDDIPPVVSINEAVDLAKYFNSRESGKFVNGILDRLRSGLKRPSRQASSPRADAKSEPSPTTSTGRTSTAED
jgi:N utilization substance protein B